MKTNNNLPEQFRATIENGYKYLFGFDKEVPEDMTLKELVELMVIKYRDADTITDEQMAMNIYAVCATALVPKSYAYGIRFLNNNIISASFVGKDGEVYL